MSKHTEFDVFRDYVTLKVHFNEWRFNWNPERTYDISVDSYRKRKDKHCFTRMVAIKPSRNEWIEYFISAFMQNRRKYVGDMFDEELEDEHRNRMSHRRALEYNFRVDCDNIRDHLQANAITFPQLLKIGISQPRLFETRIEGGVTEETIAILDKFFNFTRFQTNNMLWEETRLKVHKYSALIDVEPKRFKQHIDTLIST